MAYSNTSEMIEALALAFGDKVYLDVAKWHLYLQDAKLHIPLAEKLYPLIHNNSLNQAAVTTVLSQMTVPIGGGRQQLALLDLIPTTGVANLMQALEDFQLDL